jgi:hypothetical protein
MAFYAPYNKYTQNLAEIFVAAEEDWKTDIGPHRKLL